MDQQIAQSSEIIPNNKSNRSIQVDGESKSPIQLAEPSAIATSEEIAFDHG